MPSCIEVKSNTSTQWFWKYQWELGKIMLKNPCFPCQNTSATTISSLKLCYWLTTSEYVKMCKSNGWYQNGFLVYHALHAEFVFFIIAFRRTRALIKKFSGRTDYVCQEYWKSLLRYPINWAPRKNEHVYSFFVIVTLEGKTTSVEPTSNNSKKSVGFGGLALTSTLTLKFGYSNSEVKSFLVILILLQNSLVFRNDLLEM